MGWKWILWLASGVLIGCVLSACGDDRAPGAGGAAPGGKGDDPAAPAPDAGERGHDAGGGEGCPYDGTAPQKQAFFTHRVAGGDLTIEDELVRLTEAAVPGSRLRVAIYRFQRLRVVDALVAASRRGVDVRIVIDERNQVEDPPDSGQWRWNDAITALLDQLGEDRVVICGGGDVPQNGGACMGVTINHNKFLLASELCDGSRDVVAQSSANFTNSQLILHNNMVVIRGDQPLFEAYEAYWDDLATDQQDLSYYREADGDSGTRVYLFPRGPRFVNPETDTIYTMLDQDVDCAAGAHIRFAESIWTQPRVYIVELLRRLADEGCQVEIIYNNASTRESVAAALHQAFSGEQLRRGKHIHHKYILIEGSYQGSHRRLVWTGSHNLTHGALRENDETLLRIDDEAIYQAFLADWQVIRDLSVPVDQL